MPRAERVDRSLTHKADGKRAVRPCDDHPRVPTIHRAAGYAFRFRATDRDEPPHIHVEGNGGHAKFWLHSLGLAKSAGYNRYQLVQIRRIVEAHESQFTSRWHEYFG